MTIFHKIITNADKFTRDHAPAILAGVGIAGVISTAGFAARSSWHAKTLLDQEENPDELSLRDKVELTWKFYIPPVVSGTVTVVAIVMTQRAGARQVAAAQTAFVLTERAYSEYRDYVRDQIGETKEEQLRSQIAQDKVTANPPKTPELVMVAEGKVLFLEQHTGRYFLSTMEEVKRALNQINHQTLNNMYATLDDLYYILGLDSTTMSGRLGWDSDKLLDLEFSAAITPDDKPCIVITYNYLRDV